MKWLEHWGETYAFFILIVGLIISIAVPSAVLSYLTIIACGVIVGRSYYMQRHKKSALFWFVVIGFIIGYTIGALINEYSLIITAILFVVGWKYGSYMMRKKLVK